MHAISLGLALVTSDDVDDVVKRSIRKSRSHGFSPRLHRRRRSLQDVASTAFLAAMSDPVIVGALNSAGLHCGGNVGIGGEIIVRIELRVDFVELDDYRSGPRYFNRWLSPG